MEYEFYSTILEVVCEAKLEFKKDQDMAEITIKCDKYNLRSAVEIHSENLHIEIIKGYIEKLQYQIASKVPLNLRNDSRAVDQEIELFILKCKS